MPFIREIFKLYINLKILRLNIFLVQQAAQQKLRLCIKRYKKLIKIFLNYSFIKTFMIYNVKLVKS